MPAEQTSPAVPSSMGSCAQQKGLALLPDWFTAATCVFISCRHLSDYLTTCKEDIVLLQEVWVDADAQLLIASGRAAGLVHATHFRWAKKSQWHIWQRIYRPSPLHVICESILAKLPQGCSCLHPAFRSDKIRSSLASLSHPLCKDQVLF